MNEGEVKQQVRQFYDQVGWQQVEDGNYQNARYEDLRPVSAEYIHRCHLRVNRYLPDQGRFLLDAGSGPVQYPEYLTYSQHYDYRVCVDLSIVALREARKRLGERGLFVVADVSHLPFKNEAFDGAVTLHTFHHLPIEDTRRAYYDLFRVLAKGSRAVVVNGWTDSSLMAFFYGLVQLSEWLGAQYLALKGKKPPEKMKKAAAGKKTTAAPAKDGEGTYIQKMDPDWLQRELGGKIPFSIFVWRSVSVYWLRALIHRQLCGKWILKVLFWLEEKFPHYFGKIGQYPLIVIEKPASVE